VNRISRTLVMGTAALTAAGCSSNMDPVLPVTVLVHNTTCDIGPCVPVHVLAFPHDQPLTPGGLWSIDLGLLGSASGCLLLPPSATFTVRGPEGVEARLNWQPGDRVSLGTILPGQSQLMASPSTSEFVPSDSRGWTVDLPTGATLERATACEPLIPPG
jgi:hypothetical protein